LEEEFVIENNESIADNGGSVIQSLKNQQNKFLSNGAADQLQLTTYTAEVELLHLLKNCGVSMLYYDKIMRWAYMSVNVYHHDFKSRPVKKETVISKIVDQFDLNRLRPKKVDFVLPSTGSL
jgi:hypothetical protein